MRGKLRDMSGERYGHLTVLHQNGWYVAPGQTARRSMWLCRCDCGAEVTVLQANLVSGNSRSCGCTRGAAVSAANLKRRRKA